MSHKRQATSDLNHDNWDQDEESEEAGTFKTASEKELSSRVIKRARRRIGPAGASVESSENTGTNKVFKGFSVFSNASKGSGSGTSSGALFSFLSKIPAAGETAVTSSTAESTKSSTAPTFSFGTSSSSSSLSNDKASFSFGSSAPATNTTSSFSFGTTSTTTKTTTSTSNTSIVSTASSASIASSVSTAPTFNFVPSNPPAKKDELSLSSKKETDDEKREVLSKSGKFCGNLKKLNETFLAWLKKQHDENPLCIFSNIFKEYNEYIEGFEKEEAANANKEAISKFIFAYKPMSTNFSGTSPTKKTEETKDKGKDEEPKTNGFGVEMNKPSSGFSFGTMSAEKKCPEEATKTDSSNTLSATKGFSGFGSTSSPFDTNKTGIGFSFGTSSASAGTFKFSTASTNTSSIETKPAPPSFSFGSIGGKGFSFGNIQPPPPPVANEQEEDEKDDEPPKNEFKQVVEEDAVYSKKCKVFVKKDNNFVDKGVGTVYLKPVPNSNKAQLLVRADTNLGNVLLNFILNEAIPTQRTGKNNVMIVCLPTPDDTKPTPILIRVKTGEDADELLKEIEKYKK